LYAYHIGLNTFLLIINASRIDADLAWLQRQHDAFAGRGEVRLQNACDQFGAVAVQGPRVAEFIAQCLPPPPRAEAAARPVSALLKNEVTCRGFADGTIYVARTGY